MRPSAKEFDFRLPKPQEICRRGRNRPVDREDRDVECVPRGDGGAEHVIDYSCEDVRERVKTLTKGEGIDVGVDNIGGTLFLTLARLMRWNGRLIPMGFVGGEIPSVPMNLPLLKNYSIVGVFAGAWMTNFPHESAEAADKVMALVGEGALLRFYVLHCVGIPLIAGILMAVHFWRVRKDGGISGPV